MDSKTSLLMKRLKEELGIFPFSIKPIHDAPELLGVYVYCVPESKVKCIKDTLLCIEDEVFGDSEYGLIPRIKDLEVSRVHYFQFYTQYIYNNVTKRLEDTLLNIKNNILWKTGQLNVSCGM